MTSHEAERKTRLERLKYIERLILLPLLLLAVGAFFSFGRAVVVGVSMAPTLHSGQRVTILKAWKLFSPLKEDDIIVVKAKLGQKNREDEVVKRVVFIQNERGDRTWPKYLKLPTGIYPTGGLFRQSTIDFNTPKGIYVLGDNINNSTDSRDFGSILESEIIGKVLR